MAYSLAMYQAVSIVIYIAIKKEECGYEFCTTKSISEKLGIAAPTTVKILNKLNAAGITMTKEGAKGGVLLAKSPNEITLLDIFLILEQDRPLFKTGLDLKIFGEGVDILKEKIQESLADAEKAMKISLQQVTIKSLMQ